MTKKRVYVSSTFVDLVEHRRVLAQALERAQFDVECMEKYPSFDQRPKDKCLEDVAHCDYYVLVLALRYGFRPPRDNPKRISITQMEHEEAGRQGKTCLTFLLDPTYPWPPGHVDANALRPRTGIGAFRHRVTLEHGPASFTTPDSLATKVLESLRAHEHSRPTAGATSHAAIRARYLEWLRRECEGVELLGLDLKDSQNVRLGQVYVPAVTAPKVRTATSQQEEAGRERQHALLLDRLGEDSLYVPGAPGAGKSTFCRWVSLAVASGTMPPHPVETPAGFEERLPDALRDRFPVLCRLREWAGHHDCLAGNGHWTRAQLEDALCRWLAAARPGDLTPEVFREELAEGRCLLILDGVDEVPERSDSNLPRRNLLSGLGDALPRWLQDGSRPTRTRTRRP